MKNDTLYTEQLRSSEHPHLMMLHGWGGTLESLRPLGALLQEHAVVHLVDLPGFGRSSAPPSSWSTFDYADYLISHMNQIGVKTFDLFGHSFGGKIALAIAIRYPERIRRLILVAPSGLRRKRSLCGKMRFFCIQMIGKMIKEMDLRFATSFYASKFIPRFGSKDYQQAGALRPILVRSVKDDYSGFLSTIQASTLLLWGEEDQETPLEMGLRLQKAISGAKLLSFPGKQHHPFAGTGAHLCAYHIQKFLSRPV